MNPNNCKSCQHKHLKEPGDTGWCYMFRDEPSDWCMQHKPIQEELLDVPAILRPRGVIYD